MKMLKGANKPFHNIWVWVKIRLIKSIADRLRSVKYGKIASSKNMKAV